MAAPRIPAEVLHAAQSARTRKRRDPRPSLLAQVAAHITACSLDRQLSVGMPSSPGRSLLAHRARLLSPKERQAIAEVLNHFVGDAMEPPVSLRIPLNGPGILAVTDLIDRIVQRLESADPVCERGVARIRVLLSDGAGPLYRHGRGDLAGRLGAALAAL
ncbi:hypothetical protein [Mycobacterium sp. 236(2023)]|uniref:hypothetical protein n=1 Tax=Mycobacterium sp. 236(2023) TaxID=3038163 RepID=UPI002415819F|nr:hypothetical protein [Mycobacterium sp. 236(2023)]MDG4666867.1 hypothetical protein [Mycobacterium sp. 236(2023)]